MHNELAHTPSRTSATSDPRKSKSRDHISATLAAKDGELIERFIHNQIAGPERRRVVQLLQSHPELISLVAEQINANGPS